jgi:hypothetical protein
MRLRNRTLEQWYRTGYVAGLAGVTRTNPGIILGEPVLETVARRAVEEYGREAGLTDRAIRARLGSDAAR